MDSVRGWRSEVGKCALRVLEIELRQDFHEEGAHGGAHLGVELREKPLLHCQRRVAPLDVLRLVVLLLHDLDV
jgi:hypothetical protein